MFPIIDLVSGIILHSCTWALKGELTLFVYVMLFSGASGGILSASRKRKLNEVIMRDRELHEEAEASKKYSGPVGKNPWGAIAEDWTTSKKKRDFSEDLQLFALQGRYSVMS